MKNSKFIYIVLIVIDISLLLFCGYFFITKDRQAPVISFSENETLYFEGIDEHELLKGTGAFDKKDGDVSSRVVVEKIIFDAESMQATVYYAVSDHSGNVAKASRVFDTSESIKVKNENN